MSKTVLFQIIHRSQKPNVIQKNDLMNVYMFIIITCVSVERHKKTILKAIFKLLWKKMENDWEIKKTTLT